MAVGVVVLVLALVVARVAGRRTLGAASAAVAGHVAAPEPVG
jgi:uncharacterized membrane protein YcaP (DUF421 family)